MFKLAEVLSKIDQQGVSAHSINRARRDFQLIDDEGANVWRSLSEFGIVKGNTEKKSVEKTVIECRQIASRMLLHLISTPQYQVSWRNRLSWCRDRDDYLRLFEMLRIPHDKWRERSWMITTAKCSPDSGGIGKDLGQLVKSIAQRFRTYEAFVARMDGHLPFEGISSKAQAIELLNQEIRRIKGLDQSHKKGLIQKREAEEVATEKFYHCNAVVREVADYLKDPSRTLVRPAVLPSELSQQAVDGKKFPKALVSDIRSQLENNLRLNSWHALVLVTVPSNEELLSADASNKRIACQRLKVGRAIADTLLQEKDLEWASRVQWCKTPEDYKQLFVLLGIEDDSWQGSPWLFAHGYQQLWKAIAGKFGSWEAFLKFMEVEDTTWIAKVAACKSRKDFCKLFEDAGIRDSWKGSHYALLEADLSGLYSAICKDKRFGSWNGFKKFMGVEVAVHRLQFMGLEVDTWQEMVAACQTPEDFKKLFEEKGIEGANWQNSAWLQANGFKSLYKTISKDKRFGSWRKFLVFMQVELEVVWLDFVPTCKTREDFLQFFTERGLQEVQWQNSEWMASNGYRGFVEAIYQDKRFGNWPSFMRFMGIDVQDPWSQRIPKIKTKKGFLELFHELGIPEEDWTKATRLRALGYQGIVKAILYYDSRFGSWSKFLQFMGRLDLVPYTDRVSSLQIKEEFLAYFRELGIKDENWRSTNWLSQNGFGGLRKSIVVDARFPTWEIFIACMDGRLPFDGLTSKRQAMQCLRQEILLLRRKGDWIAEDNNSQISRAEYDEIARQEHYNKNLVVRAVTDFLNPITKKS